MLPAAGGRRAGGQLRGLRPAGRGVNYADRPLEGLPGPDQRRGDPLDRALGVAGHRASTSSRCSPSRASSWARTGRSMPAPTPPRSMTRGGSARPRYRGERRVSTGCSGVDEGTTGVKAALFDERAAAGAGGAPRQGQPPPPAGLGRAGRRGGACAVVPRRSPRCSTDPPGEVVACGLDHQGESVLAWDAESGAPLSPIVVWQDKRSQEVLDRLTDRRGGDPAPQRPAVRPLLLGGEAGLAAGERRRGGRRPRRRDAAHGHGRLLPVRPAGRRLRDRCLDRVAHPAPHARHARLRPLAVRALRRPAGGAARGARHASASSAPCATRAGRSSCRCAARWWTSRRRWPAPAASCRGGSRRPTAPASSCSPTSATRCPQAGGRPAADRRLEHRRPRRVRARRRRVRRRARCSSGCAASWAWRETRRRSASWRARPTTRPGAGAARRWPGSARRGGARTPGRCSPGCTAAPRGANVARAALEGIAWRVADIVAAIRETVEVAILRVDGGLTNEPLLLAAPGGRDRRPGRGGGRRRDGGRRRRARGGRAPA